jgi:ketosteroid isomerase-like protein
MKRLLFLLVLFSCGKPDDATQIGKQLELFTSYTKTMNHFGVASLYAEDGVNEANVVGPKAIQQYLSANTSLRVEEFSVDAAKPVIAGDTAEQTLVYQKLMRTPKGTTVQLTGRMTLNWVRSASGRWLIRKLTISSVPKP